MFNVYLLPDASRTPFCFHFGSLRRSWRKSGTLLSCCQASPKCLSVLLGRFSAALGSLLRPSCSLLSSSCLPDSASINLFPIGGRFSTDLTTKTQAQHLEILKKTHRSPLLRGKLAEPKVTGRMFSHLSFSLSLLSSVFSLLHTRGNETTMPHIN